jgi:hypothetical protein
MIRPVLIIFWALWRLKSTYVKSYFDVNKRSKIYTVVILLPLIVMEHDKRRVLRESFNIDICVTNTINAAVHCTF